MRKRFRFALLAFLITFVWAGCGEPPPEQRPAENGPIVLKTSTLLDGKGGILHDTNIVVEGSQIARLDPNAQGTTYDLTGLTVMPGWIDTHVHITHHIAANGRAFPFATRDETPEEIALHAAGMAYQTLMAGFTTVQSVGSMADKPLRDAINRGTIPGCRILTSLRSINQRTGSPDQIREFARQVVADGADVVKIFASKSIRDGGAQTLTDEQLVAACSEAKALGKRSPVHAHSPESARAATLAGCTSIEHGAYLSDEVMQLMAEHGTYYDPNIGLILQNYLENKDAFYGSGNFDDEGFAFMEKGVDIVLETFKRALVIENLKIVFGTDATAGGNGRNYEEFIVRVRDGGQDPMAAIVSATSLAAESLNLQDTIGTIAPGLEADIIATRGNPLEDITAVRRVVFVMKGGKVYKNLASVSGRVGG
jgi:imidazolonepropionase-like amidohydrolase